MRQFDSEREEIKKSASERTNPLFQYAALGQERPIKFPDVECAEAVPYSTLSL